MLRWALCLLSIVVLLSPVAAQKTPDTVAEVDGEAISAQELTTATSALLARLQQQAFWLKQQKLQELIEDRLLAHEARRRHISLESLIQTEITSKAGKVTPEEIHMLYEVYGKRLQKPESEVEGQLRSLLLQQKIRARRHEFAKALEAKAKVSVYLEAPTPVRAVVGVDGPSRGPAGAPVTIVEFEDFQCPFCRGSQRILDQVLLRYKDKVRLVHRDFPLQSLHPSSWKAHEAARCAEERGKFWQYRELLYKNPPATTEEQLTSYASQLGLDPSDFKKCLDSGKFKPVVQKDEDEAIRLGVQGTPAFFINGQFLAGAQPESEFVRIIDQELNQRAQQQDHMANTTFRTR
jgi:protein-disulfide isomerase